MKKSKILLFLIIVFSIIMFSSKVMAETLPELIITSEKLDAGDNIKWKITSEVAVGETLQLYVFMANENEACDNQTDCGWVVDEANLNGVVWEIDDSNIAKVDSNGKVTAISEGSTTIYATYKEDIVALDINITPKRTETKSDTSTGISSGDNTTTPDEITTRPDDNTTTKPDGNTSSENSDVATPLDSNNTNKETNNTTIIIVAGVVCLLLVGGAIWYFAKNKKNV